MEINTKNEKMSTFQMIFQSMLMLMVLLDFQRQTKCDITPKAKAPKVKKEVAAKAAKPVAKAAEKSENKVEKVEKKTPAKKPAEKKPAAKKAPAKKVEKK